MTASMTYEHVSVRIDSGASEMVALEEHFASCPLVTASATGAMCSSAAATHVETIRNLVEKHVEVTDTNGIIFQVKVQICCG